VTTGDQATGAPSPGALIPALDDRQLSALHEVGREWDQVSDDPDAWRRALPLDPDLGRYPAAAEMQPTTFGRVGRLVRSPIRLRRSAAVSRIRARSSSTSRSSSWIAACGFPSPGR
jgi:hypothetical protein